MGDMFGGGSNEQTLSPQIPNARVPSIDELYGQAVSASINQLPRLLDAYGQYAPQYVNQQKSLYPEKTTTQTQLSQELVQALQSINQGGGGALPDTIRTPALNYLRSAQSARGQALSPVSSLEEMQYLGGLGEQYRQNVTGSALQFLNTNDIGGTTSIDTLGLTPMSPTNLTNANYNLEGMNLDQLWDTYNAENAAYTASSAGDKGIFQSAINGVGNIGSIASELFGSSGSTNSMSNGTNQKYLTKQQLQYQNNANGLPAGGTQF